MVIRPLWAAVMLWQIASPRPVPRPGATRPAERAASTRENRSPAHPQRSRWLTFDLEGRRRLAAGDWIGNEARAPSPPSHNPTRRY